MTGYSINRKAVKSLKNRKIILSLLVYLTMILICCPAGAQSEKAEEPGPSVPAPEQEKLIKAIFSGIVDGKDVRDDFDPWIIIGWGMWEKLKPETRKKFDVKPIILEYDGKHKTSVSIYRDDLFRLFKTDYFPGLLSSLKKGAARPATEGERKSIKPAAPFRFSGIPVTVLEKDTDRMGVLLKNRKIFFLDLPGEYHKKK